MRTLSLICIAIVISSGISILAIGSDECQDPENKTLTWEQSAPVIAPFDGGPQERSPVRSDAPLTTKVVDEVESNNDWLSANKLPSDPDSSFELHGNISPVNDFDFFYFTLQGGAGPVDRVTITPLWLDTDYSDDLIVAWIWAFYPMNSLNHNPADEISIALEFWGSDSTFWRSLSFDASYSGIYGMIIRYPSAPLQGPMAYNFSISIDRVTPRDPYNDMESSMHLNMSQQIISSDMITNRDTFDWFYLIAPDPVHPTQLALTFSMSGTYPDRIFGQYEYGIQVDVFVYYDSRSDPGNYALERFKISPKPNFQSAGCMAPPASIVVSRNCTQMYVGFLIMTFGMDASGLRQYSNEVGNTNYNADFKIEALIPNNRPVLRNGSVDPMYGNSQTIFKYSVLYIDWNNQTPASLELWVNGRYLRSLSPDDSHRDHVLGVTYSVSVPGSAIGPNQLNTFNFSASDGEDIALFRSDGLGPFSGPIINDNLPPKATVSSPYTIDMKEDQEDLWLHLEPLFTDPDDTTVFSYQIMDQDGDWGIQYDDGEIKARIYNNGTFKDPDHWLSISTREDVNGIFMLRINASDNAFYPEYAELDLRIVVENVNDRPVIEMVGNVRLESRTRIDLDTEQGKRVNLQVLATDVDGDPLTYHWDIASVLHGAKKGVNFDLNASSGELWFITSDPDVPQLMTTLTVSDPYGEFSNVEVLFYVDNVNDPPSIFVPPRKATFEGESVYINPVASDPDLDKGDFLTFYLNLGALAFVAPPNAIEFDPETGRLVVHAIAEAMNGEWEINISVSDLEMEVAWGVCHLTIENKNDAPVARDINADVREKNLTVSFFTQPGFDEDGDDIIYIWDFGDGSPELSDIDLRRVTHTYSRAGAYTVTLKLSDTMAFSEEKTLLVQVTEPDPVPDLDNDGMLDEWEVRSGLNPNDPKDADMDPDGDGLTNLQEFLYYQETGRYINPMNPDTDGDGWSDLEEIREGTDPTDPSSYPSPKYADIELLFMVLGSLLILFALVLLFIFLVIRRRNKAAGAFILPPAQPIAAPQYDQMPPNQQGYLTGPDGDHYLPPPVQDHTLPPYPPVEGQQPESPAPQFPDMSQGAEMEQNPQYEDMYGILEESAEDPVGENVVTSPSEGPMDHGDPSPPVEPPHAEQQGDEPSPDEVSTS
ncbi:MAG: PKD domain-containing protein [Candidatus Thermoplasmatota archaeon]|nr:PKD domain-containing protein [Candidatus Thermoplasmatota archaeon]